MSAKLHRRKFLRYSAMGAASAAIVACGGAATAEPTVAPEAPEKKPRRLPLYQR
jgi:hypothetical protein